MFFTFAPDDVNTPLVVRMAIPSKGNEAFPARADATVDGKTRSLADALANGDASFLEFPLNNRALRQRLVENPAAAAEVFRIVVMNVFSVLMGVADTATEKTSFPYAAYRNIHCFGRPVAAYGVIETQARGTLHCHLLFWGLVPPDLVAELARYPALRDEFVALVQSHFAAAVQPEHWAARLAHLADAKSAKGGDSADDAAADHYMPKNAACECPCPLRSPKQYHDFVQQMALCKCTHVHTHTCYKNIAKNLTDAESVASLYLEQCRFGIPLASVECPCAFHCLMHRALSEIEPAVAPPVAPAKGGPGAVAHPPPSALPPEECKVWHGMPRGCADEDAFVSHGCSPAQKKVAGTEKKGKGRNDKTAEPTVLTASTNVRRCRPRACLCLSCVRSSASTAPCFTLTCRRVHPVQIPDVAERPRDLRDPLPGMMRAERKSRPTITFSIPRPLLPPLREGPWGCERFNAILTELKALPDGDWRLRDVQTFWQHMNGVLTSYADLPLALLGCNMEADFIGTHEQAVNASFYLSSYITKNAFKVRPVPARTRGSVHPCRRRCTIAPQPFIPTAPYLCLSTMSPIVDASHLRRSPRRLRSSRRRGSTCSASAPRQPTPARTSATPSSSGRAWSCA